MTPTLPGDLTSPIAGSILRRGAPVHPVDHFEENNPAVVVCMDEDGAYIAGEAGDREVCLSAGSVPLGMLALDLSDPAGMDRAARWLAAHHGLVVGATAPNWYCEDVLGGIEKWRLHSPLGSWRFQKPERSPTSACDPVEALAAACLAAGGRAP